MKSLSVNFFQVSWLMPTIFSLVAVSILWPLIVLGLNCDDYMYYAFSRSASFAEILKHLPGATTRPVSTWLFVALLKLDDPENILGVLRFFHHILNSLMLGYVVQKSLRASPTTCWIAALGFLAWGSHGEIYYFSAIHDLLATSFTLFALAFSLSAKPKLIRFFLVGLCSIVAYHCKESAWPLPFLLAFIPRKTPPHYTDVASSSLALLLTFAARLATVGSLRGDLEPGIYRDIGAQNILRSTSKLLLRSFIPGTINLQNLANTGKQHGLPFVIAAAVIVAAVIYALSKQEIEQAQRSVLARSGICFLFALAPACQLSVSVETFENARYLYLSTALLIFFLSSPVDTFLHSTSRRIRVCTVLVVAVCVAAQGASLNVAGLNWIEASRLTRHYVASLEKLLKKYDGSEHVYLMCAPDNFRGAFSARNVSTEIARIQRTPGRVDVLATKYVSEKNSQTLCAWANEKNSIIVNGDLEKRTLTHPLFCLDDTSVKVGSWELGPIDFFNQRSRSVRLTRRNGMEGGIVAIYTGDDFAVVMPSS